MKTYSYLVFGLLLAAGTSTVFAMDGDGSDGGSGSGDDGGRRRGARAAGVGACHRVQHDEQLLKLLRGGIDGADAASQAPLVDADVRAAVAGLLGRVAASSAAGGGAAAAVVTPDSELRGLLAGRITADAAAGVPEDIRNGIAGLRATAAAAPSKNRRRAELAGAGAAGAVLLYGGQKALDWWSK